jgi:SRSO17 transposase
MDIGMDAAAETRLRRYFDQIGEVLGNDGRRTNFAQYACGLLGEADRKSMERIATRHVPDPAKADAAHQRVQHFITDSRWDDHAVRLNAARYALAAMTQVASVWAWIIDDTGFLKKGRHSVGVQRQYTGSAGKITNCQVGVSLTLATPQDHVPVDFELYLPDSWANDPDRRAEARIPDHVGFKTKPQLALDMLRRAVEADLPRGTVLADEVYGNSSEFRDGVRKLKLNFAAAINATTTVWVVDALGRRNGRPLSVSAFAENAVVRGQFRRLSWREGTQETLSARFAFARVVPVRDDGCEPRRRERLWLVCEWRDGEDHPAHFYFATYRRVPYGFLVHLLKERWRTERVYQDLKGQLGLDHFEGRRFRGWHHHVSVALACFAYVAAERARLFPPSADRAQEAGAFAVAA